MLGQQLAATVDMAEDVLLELRHLLSQQAPGGRQVVFWLLTSSLSLQGEMLQFALGALGGCKAVEQPIALSLDVLLCVHVDERYPQALAEAWQVGHLLWLILEHS